MFWMGFDPRRAENSDEHILGSSMQAHASHMSVHVQAMRVHIACMRIYACS